MTARLLPLLIAPAGEPTPPEPTGPTHTATIVAVSGGYNGVNGNGSIDTATYSTPAGKSVTIIHCRNVRGELNFALQASPQPVEVDFPTRIVATKLTGGEVEITLGPQAGSLRPISDGAYMRMDYDPVRGAVGDVFVNGQTIRVDLYYD